MRFWSNDQLMASRYERGGSRILRLVNIDSGAMTALSAPHPASADDYGDVNGYELPSGLYATTLSGCGSTLIDRLDPDGAVTTLTIPNQGNEPALMGTVGADLIIVAGPVPAGAHAECIASPLLETINPVTGSSRVIVPALVGDNVLAYAGSTNQSPCSEALAG